MAAVVAAVAGLAVASGYGEVLLAALAGAIVVTGVVVRPDLALLAWVGLLLAVGRDFSKVSIGPFYVTEPFLAVLAFAIALRLLLSKRGRPGMPVALIILALLVLPAVVGLLTRTTLSDPAWMRQFAIIHYAAFAVLAAFLAHRERFLRRLLIVTLVASTVALALVFSEGQEVKTSTGALRIAHGSYAIPFGVAPLLLIGLVRERLVRKTALLATLPLLIGLLLVNHRSGWIAFVAAVSVLLASRPAAPARLALAASGILTALVLAAVYIYSPGSAIADSVDRATTVFETRDPNAAYRLSFWSALIDASLTSPVVGSGFDPYPPEFVPPKTTRGDVDYAPHNSFVALAYRVGPIFLAIVLGVLLWLMGRALRLARHEPDPAWRFALTGLVAVTVHIGVFAAFNVVLELPYMAPLFWVTVGVLAATVAARTRAASYGNAAAREPVRS